MRPPALLLALLLAPIVLAGCTVDAPHPGTRIPAEDATSSGALAPCMERVRASLPNESLLARGSGEVVLLTHDSFTVSEDAFTEFTNRTGYTVRAIRMGDAGEALNKALLTKDAPLGDVLFGVDNALIHRAKAEALFQPYASPALAAVDDRFAAPFCEAGRMLATPVDYGYVTLNVDTAWMRERGIPLPTDLRELSNATYAKLTVVENPRTSSPGFAFLLATVDRFGTEGNETYQDFWRAFRENGGRVAAGWEQAYGEDFTQGWSDDGARDRPIVVSYSTSPAFTPMNDPAAVATSENLDLPKGAWFQVEAAGILRNARNPDGAKALVDHMLTPAFQEDAALRMVVHPVHRDAAAPEAYARYAPEPKDPASISPEAIDAGREAWLKGWAQATGQV